MRSSSLFLGVLAALLVAAGTFAADKDKAKDKDKESQSKLAQFPSEIDGKTLEQWIAEMTHKDPAVRVEAVETLPRFGPPARKAASALVKCLEDGDVSVRVHAIRSLASIGVDPPDMGKTVEGLSARLRKDQQAIVRVQAAIALSAFGSDAKAAIPALIERISDRSSWEIRKAAIVSLGNVALDKKNGPDIHTINALGTVLTAYPPEDSVEVRKSAAIAIGGLGRPKQDVDVEKEIALLRRGLTVEKDKTVLIWTYVAILAIDNTISEKDVAVLLKFLKPAKDSKVVVREHAARAIGTIGRRGGKEIVHQMIAGLVDALQDKEDRVATSAAWALGRMEGIPETQLEIVGKLLGSSFAPTRMHACSALGFIGKDAKSQTAALEGALEDKEVTVVMTALWALTQVGDPSETTLAKMGKLLQHEDPQVRLNVVQTLGTLGPKAKSQIPSLITALNDKELGVRGYAALALGQMGEAAASAIPALQAITFEKKIDERLKAAVNEALEQIKSKAKARAGA
jgi:HEAT repeat protein